MVWGGATFDAIKRIKAMQNKPRLRVIMPRKFHERDEERERDRESFSCFQLCGNCGYLGDANAEPCPSCGAKGWIDLGDLDMAHALRKADSEDRMLPSDGARRLTWLTALGAGVFGGLVLGFAGGALVQRDVPEYAFIRYKKTWVDIELGDLSLTFAPVLAAFATVAITSFVYHAFKMRLFAAFHERRNTRPDRWRLPLPSPELSSPVVDRVEGVATARGTLLRAPISGRECIAYEVSVLFDAEGDARRPMWVLEEENMIAFELAGRELGPDRATLEIPLEPVAPDEHLLNSDELSLFLRKRGLFGSDGVFEFYEALVLPGARYQLLRHEEPEGAVAVLRPTTS